MLRRSGSEPGAYLHKRDGTVPGRRKQLPLLASGSASPFARAGGWRIQLLTLYFCLDGSPAVVRYWAAAPRIGETIALPELGGNLNPLRVYDVIWEGTIDPSVSVYVHHAKVDHAICNNVPHGSQRHGQLDEYSRR